MVAAIFVAATANQAQGAPKYFFQGPLSADAEGRWAAEQLSQLGETPLNEGYVGIAVYRLLQSPDRLIRIERKRGQNPMLVWKKIIPKDVNGIRGGNDFYVLSGTVDVSVHDWEQLEVGYRVSSFFSPLRSARGINFGGQVVLEVLGDDGRYLSVKGWPAISGGFSGLCSQIQELAGRALGAVGLFKSEPMSASFQKVGSIWAIVPEEKSLRITVRINGAGVERSKIVEHGSQFGDLPPGLYTLQVEIEDLVRHKRVVLSPTPPRFIIQGGSQFVFHLRPVPFGQRGRARRWRIAGGARY